MAYQPTQHDPCCVGVGAASSLWSEKVGDVKGNYKHGIESFTPLIDSINVKTINTGRRQLTRRTKTANITKDDITTAVHCTSPKCHCAGKYELRYLLLCDAYARVPVSNGVTAIFVTSLVTTPTKSS